MEGCQAATRSRKSRYPVPLRDPGLRAPPTFAGRFSCDHLYLKYLLISRHLRVHYSQPGCGQFSRPRCAITLLLTSPQVALPHVERHRSSHPQQGVLLSVGTQPCFARPVPLAVPLCQVTKYYPWTSSFMPGPSNFGLQAAIIFTSLRRGLRPSPGSPRWIHEGNNRARTGF